MAMAKFEELAATIRQQITAGVWQVGEKLPSLREQTFQSGMSLMTVMHSYQILEGQGWIISRPQSGYYVAPKAEFLSVPKAQNRMAHIGKVDMNAYIFDILQTISDPDIVPFGSAFPDPSLSPLSQVTRALAAVAREITTAELLDYLPPGNFSLRSAIAKRYAQAGVNVSPDEIVITAGALESLNLSLQAVTKPGDWVVIEDPCFYGALQAVEKLGLNAVSVTSDPQSSIDLAALADVLASTEIKACWLMTNSQNPLGYTLSIEKKRQLAAMLEQHNVVLIEDDVYSELYFGQEKPKPAMAYMPQRNSLHCGSFSKSLVAGFRIGWVAAGNYAEEVKKLQLMSTLSTSVPMQLALAKYLSTQNYDRHLRGIRKTLEQRKNLAWQCLKKHLPENVIINYSASGYFLWIELPAAVDASRLCAIMLDHHVSIAPGNMFTTGGDYNNYFRINVSYPWNSREEEAVMRLSSEIRRLENPENIFGYNK